MLRLLKIADASSVLDTGKGAIFFLNGEPVSVKLDGACYTHRYHKNLPKEHLEFTQGHELSLDVDDRVFNSALANVLN